MLLPPPWLVRAVTKTADVLARLRRRLMPRRLAALELATGSWVAQAVSAFCELGLHEALARKAATAQELASQGYGQEPQLYRLLRVLAAYDVTRHAGGGRFTLGYAGEGLVGEYAAAPMVRYGNVSWHADAYIALPDAVRSGRPGFHCANGLSLFEFLSKNSEARELFDTAMQALTPMFGAAIARGYDFSPVARVVDVGGGTGALLAAILKRYPKIRGTVFELPGAAAHARERSFVWDLADRLEVVEGNIFETAPPQADAYILSHVLHDWDDEACIRILRNVRKAMSSAARLLVYEIVAARLGNAWTLDRLQDLEMLAMLSGRERTREEYAALFAVSGLELARVIATSAAESILEVRSAS